MKSKRCTLCRITKPLTEFRKKKEYGDGRASHCLECEEKRKKKKKEEEKEYRKKYFNF